MLIVSLTDCSLLTESEYNMSRNHKESEAPVVVWKNESSRQRWELFHRAIAHAKATNQLALVESDTHADDNKVAAPVLSIVR